VLSPGDTVLFLSDGFPELFNEAGEMLGYVRVEELFREAARGRPAEIVHALSEAASKWRGSRPQDDDITFIVMQKRSA
jgi:serine phosphatase RsbU (regulator of sigma subunit)